MSKKSILEIPTIKLLMIFIVVALLFMNYMNTRKKNHFKEAASLPFYKVSPSEVDDGIYQGKVYTTFQHMQLSVTVKNHQISDIQIIENKGQYGQKLEAVISEMIAKNSSVVPAIKGDELGCIVAVSCVDDALNNGKKESSKNQIKESDEN